MRAQGRHRRLSSAAPMTQIRSRIVAVVASMAGAVTLAQVLSAGLRDESTTTILSNAGLTLTFAVALWLHRTRPELGGFLFSVGGLSLISFQAYDHGFTDSVTVSTYVTMVVIAGLAWDSRGAIVLAALSSAFLLLLAQNSPIDPATPIQAWAELTMQLMAVAIAVHLTLRALTRAHRDGLTQERRFREVTENSPEAIIVLDREQKVRLFNPKAVALSGYSAEDVLGKQLDELDWLTPSAFQMLMAQLKWVSVGTVPPLELETVHEDGLVEASVSQVVNPAGGKDRLISLRDISERRRLEKAERALEERLVVSRSLESLGRLAGGVAHDFNNLLTVILSTIDLMRLQHRVAPEIDEDIAEIEGAAGRAAELTSQLLAFGRRQVLEPQVISPNAALQGLRPLLERLLPEHVTIQMCLGESTGNIKVDQARLEQIIINLATNASDAMPLGGKLTIETTNRYLDNDYAAQRPDISVGDYVEIAITDTGQGMSPETISHIFEPFFTTKLHGSGTGLGLAMVHGIIKQSGGHIHVYSEEGQGTCFRVYLPLCDAALSKRTLERKHEQVGRLRVLLVEDDKKVRSAVRRMLEADGHHVEEATDGEDALDRYGERATEFDLLLTDVIMPRMNGRALSEKLLTIHPSLRVLFASGYTENAIVHQGVLVEGLHYLPKPFNRHSLTAKLSEIFSTQ